MSQSIPKVLIDARMVSPRLNGIARYVSLLAQGLRARAQEKPLSYEPVFLVDRKIWEPGSELLGNWSTISCDAPFLSPREWIEIPSRLKSAGATIYHSTSFASLPKCPVPWIQTLHDLNHLTYGGWKEKLYYRTLLRRFATGARALVAASQTAKLEIEDWLQAPPGRVRLARNALDPSFTHTPPEAERDAVLKKFGLVNGKFFLSLSPHRPHKNLETLLAAYAMAEAETSAGGGRGIWPLVLTAADLPEVELPTGVIRAITPRNEEVRALLAAAGALVFPSLYEGFGLPPLEAAVSGTPVLVSRIPAHEEALAPLRPEEVVWLPARDARAWASAMKRAAQGIFAKASAPSRARLQEEFNYRKLARDMDQVYRDVLDRLVE